MPRSSSCRLVDGLGRGADRFPAIRLLYRTPAAGAQFLGGVTVGDGATVEAMRLVIDHVPSGSTVAGVQARVLT